MKKITIQYRYRWTEWKEKIIDASKYEAWIDKLAEKNGGYPEVRFAVDGKTDY